MKKITNALRIFALTILLLSHKPSEAQCLSSFVYTLASNGTILLNSTSITNSTTTYYWYHGVSNTILTGTGSAAMYTSYTFTANGTYVISLLTIQASPSCSNVSSQTVTVGNVTTCPINAGFTYTVGSNGSVSFFNTTTPTLGVNYTWSFGNSAFSNTIHPYQTYTANGVYTVNLTASTNSFCVSQASAVVTVTNVSPCSINANFGTTQALNGLVNFNNYSTGTVSGTTYNWNFGDNTAPSSAVSPVHTYSANGTYMAKLVANNNFTATCIDSVIVPVVVSSYCNVSPSFTYTINGGMVTFSNTTINTSTTNPMSFIWYFGNSNWSNATNPSTTYTNNGVYSVSLTSMAGICTLTAVQSITITNSSACAINAGFAVSTGSMGATNFNNTTTGTVSATTYSWNFGDSSPASNLTSPSHTYASNGNYVVTLNASNNSTPQCTSSYSFMVQITNVCNIVSGFNYSINGGTVTFTNTTTPTSTMNMYYWDFGNGNWSNALNPTTTYSTNGIYNVSLKTMVGSCTNTAVQSLTISGIPTCSLSAAFSHTVGSSGQVNFTDLSTGTNSTTTYAWNFGDGWTSTSTNPSHTYINAGTHYVTLYVINSAPLACIDTVYQAINVTGISCLANSNFTMQPTNTAQYWYVIPSYPWNVSNAVWSWGDNSTSNGIYSSHQYSVAGNYNICLSVTVSCGATSSSCATYSIFRSAANIINVQAIAPAPTLEITGIDNQSADLHDIKVVPNPNNGLFSINMNNLSAPLTKIMVYNMVGQKMFEANYEAENNSLNKALDLSSQPAGVYFIKMTNGNTALTKKLVISH